MSARPRERLVEAPVLGLVPVLEQALARPLAARQPRPQAERALVPVAPAELAWMARRLAAPKGWAPASRLDLAPRLAPTAARALGEPMPPRARLGRTRALPVEFDELAVRVAPRARALSVRGPVAALGQEERKASGRETPRERGPAVRGALGRGAPRVRGPAVWRAPGRVGRRAQGLKVALGLVERPALVPTGLRVRARKLAPVLAARPDLAGVVPGRLAVLGPAASVATSWVVGPAEPAQEDPGLAGPGPSAAGRGQGASNRAGLGLVAPTERQVGWAVRLVLAGRLALAALVRAAPEPAALREPLDAFPAAARPEPRARADAAASGLAWVAVRVAGWRRRPARGADRPCRGAWNASWPVLPWRLQALVRRPVPRRMAEPAAGRMRSQKTTPPAIRHQLGVRMVRPWEAAGQDRLVHPAALAVLVQKEVVPSVLGRLVVRPDVAHRVGPSARVRQVAVVRRNQAGRRLGRQLVLPDRGRLEAVAQPVHPASALGRRPVRGGAALERRAVQTAVLDMGAPSAADRIGVGPTPADWRLAARWLPAPPGVDQRGHRRPRKTLRCHGAARRICRRQSQDCHS
jgi:hypothetical protein